MCDTEELANEVLERQSKTAYGKHFSWEVYGYPLNSKDNEE
jgi:hypothetical protein